MEPRNRAVLVTGTSSGIGAALAEVLLQNGWAVFGLARRSVTFDSPYYRHFKFDLADTGALGSFADEQLGPVFSDPRWQSVGLVNNAAVLGSLRGLHEASPHALAEVMAVNAVAPIFFMGFVARLVLPRVALRIANVSSGAATQGIPGLADYCASKAALRLAGMALAAEFETGRKTGGVRRDAAVLSYEPGIVDTNMQDVARATRPEEFPSHQVFQDFAQNGNLLRPAMVVGGIVDFLAGTGGEVFVEQRYGVA